MKDSTESGHIHMRYLDKTQLWIFLSTLICSGTALIISEFYTFDAIGFRIGCSLILIGMIHDMMILSGAWKNSAYIFHHAVTAGGSLAGAAFPKVLGGLGAGFFVSYMLLGAVTKRVRILRNWEKEREDWLEYVLKKIYTVLKKTDMAVFPCYLAWYCYGQIGMGADWLPLIMAASCGVLLVVRILLP